MKTFLNYSEILFSVRSFISSNFPPNENFKNFSFPPWFWKISVPPGFRWVQKSSPPLPPFTKEGGGGAAMHIIWQITFTWVVLGSKSTNLKTLLTPTKKWPTIIKFAMWWPILLTLMSLPDISLVSKACLCKCAKENIITRLACTWWR